MTTSRVAEAWPKIPYSTGRAIVEVKEIAPRQVMLFIDGMESSFIDLDDPTYLEFEYMQHLDAVVAASFGDAPIRALHLGGAACTLARAWDATHPGSTQLAVEWDAELARVVREWFPLPRSPQLRIRTGDARASLEAFPPARWDVIVRDAFVRGQVPDHLADDGMWAALRRAIAPDGVVMVNVADAAPFTAARRDVALALAYVGNAVAIADPAVWKGRRYGNIVVAAAPAGLDSAGITRLIHALPMPARVLAGGELEQFAR